ncbi:hypothetical protein ABW19_dt0202126 [Dactylella cylindrospora]|nr:hypothetical protein ABW19_dt0202126 [Dactylella cylindrospora]
MSIKNVLIIGASGNIGSPIVSAISAEPSLNLTILSREGSNSTFPAGIPAKRADYSSHKSLVAAFTGFDAIVSNIAIAAALDQLRFIDAAIEAGVKRFYPTEYGMVSGSDPEPIVSEWWGRIGFKGKAETYKKLKELSDAGKIEYTIIATGSFFDWGLAAGFLGFNLKEKKATILGSGNQVTSFTNTDYIGKSVAWTLTHPEESRNRTLKIFSYKASQNQILAELERITATKWSVEKVALEDHIKAGEEGVKAGNARAGYYVMQGFIYDENDRFGINYKQNDVRIRDEKTMEEVIRAVLSNSE